MTYYPHYKWRMLRLLRGPGTVLIDYRILKKFSRIMRKSAWHG